LYYLRYGGFRRVASRLGLREPFLADYLRHYECRRRRGQHGGPPLRAVRLYERRWLMNPRATNARGPDETVLVCQRSL
jgi:hypothetical protein